MPTSNNTVRRQSKRMVTKKLVGKSTSPALEKMEKEAWNHFDRTIDWNPVDRTIEKAEPTLKEPVKSLGNAFPPLNKKPNIEEVFQAFQDLQTLSQLANMSESSGVTSQIFTNARKEIKDRLEEMGLAQYIDWT